ncbi:MAG: hypothetical protein JWP12_2799 [Bacteroidetes bacterium]|nr:hypothetical protein [Bacteroidota bacterium]
MKDYKLRNQDLRILRLRRNCNLNEGLQIDAGSIIQHL